MTFLRTFLGKFALISLLGGGICYLSATELSVALPNCQNGTSCTISTNYSEITNNGNFRVGANDISINARIDKFINYGNITLSKGNSNQSIGFNTNGYIGQLINYGTMEKMFWIANNSSGIGTLTNYGRTGGIKHEVTNPLTLNNLGIMGHTYETNGMQQSINLQVSNNAKILIQNYALMLNEDATTFNAFNGGTSLSHLKISGNGVSFKDSKSKIILDFGNSFELGKEYSISKLVNGGNLGVDFSRLTTRSSLYQLKQQGNSFIVTIDAPNSEIGTLYKSNIRTMNNFTTISESMIYPHKYKGTNRSTRKRVIRRVRKTASTLFRHTDPERSEGEVSKTHESNQNIESMTKGIAKDKIKDLALDSQVSQSLQTLQDSQYLRIDSSLHHHDSSDLESSDLDSSLRELHFAQNDENKWIASHSANVRNDESFTNKYLALDSLSLNESFFYKSESLLLADSQSEQIAKRMRNSTQNLRNANDSNTNNSSANLTTRSTNPTTIQNDNYYFILTPFVNHNYFFESGRYNLSGLEYGFVTAFNGKLNNSNALGTHFVFSYASLNDKDDLAFNIKSMNLNLGLNYKLDLIYAMYVKARIDGYYFLNEVKNISLINSLINTIKPNAFGFGASISYGKEWDFRDYGLLGLEVGLDYKGLYTNDITTSNNADKSINETYNKALYNMFYVDLGLNYDKYFKSSVGLWGIDSGVGLKANVSANALSKSNITLNNNARNINMQLDNDLILAYVNIAGSYLLQSKEFDMEFSIAYYGNYGNRTMSNAGSFEWRVGW